MSVRVEQGVTATARTNLRRMNELILPARAGDRAAMDELIGLGYEFVRMTAARKRWFLPGAEPEDLVQEAMFGFLDAVRSWQPGGGEDFFVFAWVCVNREFIEAIKIYNRVKRRILTEAVRLDTSDLRGDSSPTRLARWNLPDHSGLGRDPADAVAASAETADLVAAVCGGLSALEREVFLRIALGGEEYEDTARALGRTVKSVDNALQRARSRIRRRAGSLATDTRLAPGTRAFLRRMSQVSIRKRARKVNGEMRTA